jgi:hypothetical protein
MDVEIEPPSSEDPARRRWLLKITRYFLPLGALGFGGPPTWVLVK